MCCLLGDCFRDECVLNDCLLDDYVLDDCFLDVFWMGVLCTNVSCYEKQETQRLGAHSFVNTKGWSIERRKPWGA